MLDVWFAKAALYGAAFVIFGGMIDNDLVRRRVTALVNEAEHGRLTTRRYNDAALAANYSLFLEYLGVPEAYADPMTPKGKIAWPETKVVHNHLRPFMRSATIAIPITGLLDLKTVLPNIYWPTSMCRYVHVKKGSPSPGCGCKFVYSTTPGYDTYAQEIDLVHPQKLSYRLSSALQPVQDYPIYTIEGGDMAGMPDVNAIRIYPAKTIASAKLEYLERPQVPVWVAASETALNAIELYDATESVPYPWDATLVDHLANRIASMYARHVGNVGKYQAAQQQITSGR